MNYNYHTHTRRCGHAVGQMVEYVQAAIAGGIKYMGFSEHAPFGFPGGYESCYRLPVSETEAYFREGNALRSACADRLELLIGFEMEYYPAYFEDMTAYARKSGGEYLVLGQHFIYNEIPDKIHATSIREDLERLREYVRCVVCGMESGLFSVAAHPDLARFSGDPDIYLEEMRPICSAAIETGVPLEINFLGIRDGRHYPREDFWKLAGEMHAPVTFGCDAHAPQDAADRASLAAAQDLVSRYGLNYIGRPEIRRL
ncbi:MAG: histidinol-phosphatase [Clostridia bacterium]|nr:histidinol-phosphatase [Clostridia bacterium]